ncbi:MAG: phosphotransferase [Myxococcota bacterium]
MGSVADQIGALAPPERRRWLNQLARSALGAYEVHEPEVCFLGHSESISYRVDEGTVGRCLLRIHLPVSAFFDTVGGTPEAIQSELAWLDALHSDTDIVVQQPVRTRQGDLVSRVHIGKEQTPAPCTVLRWVEGGRLTASPTPSQAHQLGRLVAGLHTHASHWEPPPGFTRPSYDWDTWAAMVNKLRHAVTIGTISPSVLQAIETAIGRIRAIVSPLGGSRQSWGLIHSDIHPGNYVTHGAELRPIDFSLCGFGHYSFDVADTMRYMAPSTRRSFLEGYQAVRELREGSQRLLEVFFILGMIRNLAFLSLNPEDQPAMREEARDDPDSIDSRLDRFLQGRSFLFEV